MTHHDLDSSISLPFHHFLLSPVSSSSFVLIPSTLDPKREASTRLVRLIVWIDSALAPGEASPRLPLIYSHILPHSRLVCQRAIVLPIRTRAHSLVSLSPRIASPFMPHSYAFHPMTHPSLLPLRYWPLPPCDL